MKKLWALARAFVIVAVALLPGFGAALTMVLGAPRESPPATPPAGRIAFVGTWVAMEPGMEEGAMQLGFARTTTPLPPGASPALVFE